MLGVNLFYVFRTRRCVPALPKFLVEFFFVLALFWHWISGYQKALVFLRGYVGVTFFKVKII